MRATHYTRVLESLEKLLPKPDADPAGYAAARTLEALTLLEQGKVRKAAGKAFQAWRAVIGALLALEHERISKMAETDEYNWSRRRASRIPTSRLKRLPQLVASLGYRRVPHPTGTALNLHDYEYHGPDPDLALSKYTSSEKAVIDAVFELVSNTLKHRLVKPGVWGKEHEEMLSALADRLRVGEGRVRASGPGSVARHPSAWKSFFSGPSPPT